MSEGKNRDRQGSGLVRTSARRPEPPRERPQDSERSQDSEPKASEPKASEQPQASESKAGEPKAREPESTGGRASSSLSTAAVAAAGLRQIAELTGKKPEGVTGVERTEDGWLVGVEIVADRRIPSSTDIMAIYEAEFDPGGELLSYRRVRRYSRGRGDSSGDE